jgi:hypothetical protein
MTEIGLFSTNLSNTAPSMGGLLDDQVEEGLLYTISSHLYTTGVLHLSNFLYPEYLLEGEALLQHA